MTGQGSLEHPILCPVQLQGFLSQLPRYCCPLVTWTGIGQGKGRRGCWGESLEDRRVEQVRLFEGGVSMLKTHDFSQVGERTEGWME